MIFLADIYDPSDGVGDAAERLAARLARLHGNPRGLQRCDPSLRRAAPVGPRRADARRVSGHGIHCTQPWRKHYRLGDPHYWYAGNLEDPNIRGYDAIRRLFLIEIAKQADQFRSAMNP